jgi:hypothetical protein
MSEFVETERDGQVLYVAYNCPEVLNALHAPRVS